jgi:NADH-quinone oxidoreductase subunit J
MVMILTHKAADLPNARMPDPAAGYNNARVLGNLIYTQYFLPFQLAAALLLVGMITAIALTLRKRKNTKYQNPAQQIAVKRDDRVRMVKMNAEARPTAGEPAANEQQPKA